MPAATGKLSIWTAKTNAAVSPAIGICFSAKRLPVSLSDAQIPPAATAAPPDRGGDVHVAVWHVHRPAAPVNASDLQYRRNQKM